MVDPLPESFALIMKGDSVTMVKIASSSIGALNCFWTFQRLKGQEKLCEKLSDENCNIRDLELREIFWEAMKKGELRISLNMLLDRWSAKNGTSEEVLVENLKGELKDGNLTILVVAASAHLQREWHERAMKDLKSAINVPEARVFLSPVLTKPPLQLLDCLDEYFKKELLVLKVVYLKRLCKSCFALLIPNSSWVGLAKRSGFSFQEEGQKKGRWILRKCKGTRRCEWTPQSDTAERKADLIRFMREGLEDWPSVGVFLESARIFGPPSLQPSPARRSRLAALYCILEEITGLESQVDSDEEEEDEMMRCADLDEKFLDGEGLSTNTRSTMFSEMDWGLFPPPMCMGRQRTWPAPRSAMQMVHLLSQECDSEKRAKSVVRGKRVLNRTRAYARLGTMLNKLRYEEGILVDGEWITEASRAAALLDSAGYDGDVIDEWVGDSNISSDLLMAMIAAKWRRFNGERNSGAAPDAQEVLGGLLLAQAMSHGQGRSHRIRKPIVGMLWRHERLRGKLPLASRGGSVGMGMDTCRSDHDIFLQIKHGDEDMVQTVYEVLLDLQRQSTGHEERLKRAKVVRKDFAVEIQDFYRGRDFDLVPYTVKPELQECQWDIDRKVWQRILHRDLAPKLQELSQEHPDGFSMTRLLKIYNESLPPLRRSAERQKAPLISLHLPLLVLGARDQQKFDSCHDPQSYFLESLKFIRERWSCEVLETVTLQEIGAEVHLQRMTKKYREAGMEEEFARRLDEHLVILTKLCEEEGRDKAAAERIIQGVRGLFDSQNLLAPEPAYRSRL
ncbi:unnamed protein product [Durusdinium trenchii]|uniref:Uncharacterized protein n=2 Tax=Durusdinium trenchii TaxID=1381693 RepID=A0ABP0KPS8_9DINO